ncbi:hypothetical protein BR93DRAFT_981110 [Coniochaeta sp. PMI_546]|nr:hypothetical protein BR93DRAFT_981110 [Coniochaeta sp. PMI_546]
MPPHSAGPFADRSILPQAQQSFESRSQLPSIPAERSDILYESTGEPFQYSSLEYHDSVRLLTLRPSQTSTDANHCSFLDVSLSTNPEYEVLSGFWGDRSPSQPASLLVDGRMCNTTPELAQALYKFRRRDRPRLFWIQSLCVDPCNLRERSGQISRVRDILLSAQRLIVWLGATEDDSNHVFEHSSQFAHLVSEENWPPPLLPDPKYGRETPCLPGASGARGCVRPYTGDDVTAAFVRLCSRPWFYRPWSIPELALSKNIMLVCGDHQLKQIPWYNPVAFLFEAHQLHHQFAAPHGVSLFADLNIPVVDPVSHVYSLSFHPHIPYHWLCTGLRMEDAYRIVRNCRSADRRDSVFAIAALEPVPPVEIDYQLSVSEIYQKATFALIQMHISIQVLRRLASSSRASDLPSWTLDFSTPLETTGAIWTLPGARFLKDRVSPKLNVEEVDAQRRSSWPCDSQAVARFTFECGKLTIPCRLMETVAAIGPPMPATVATDQSSGAFTTILAAWEELASRLQPNKRFPQSIADAFFDTLIANDAHDVLRNDPPRPLVSPVADRARQWYMYRGTRILQQADREYFSVLNDETSARAQPITSPHDVHYDVGQIWRSSREGEGSSQEFGRRVARACACKRFFITDQGSMGLAPPNAREFDVVMFVPTGTFPLFLRPRVGENATAYVLLGEGFLYDWWSQIEPVLKHRTRMGSYENLLTDCVIV